MGSKYMPRPLIPILNLGGEPQFRILSHSILEIKGGVRFLLNISKKCLKLSTSFLMMTPCSHMLIWLFLWSGIFSKLVQCETWSTIRLMFHNKDSVVLCVGFKLFNSINGCAGSKETLKLYIDVTICSFIKDKSTFVWFWWIINFTLPCLFQIPRPLNFLPLVEHSKWSMKILVLVEVFLPTTFQPVLQLHECIFQVQFDLFVFQINMPHT